MASLSRAEKARRFTGLCAGFLALGLVLFLFVHPASQRGLDILHAVVGFCLGVSGALGALAVSLRLPGKQR